MTIQKEHLEQFKQEKIKELAEVENVFIVEEKKVIEERVNSFRDELTKELIHKVDVKKATLNGELAALEKIAQKLSEPEAQV